MAETQKRGKLDIATNNAEVILTISGEFRNGLWSEEFGLSQHIFESYDKIVIDLRKLTWIDPLPSLSLLLTIVRLKSINKEQVVIIKIHKPEYNSNRVSEIFLFKYGFLKIAVKNKIQIHIYSFPFNRMDSRSYIYDQMELVDELLTELELRNFSQLFMEDSLYLNDSHILDARVDNLSRVVSDIDKGVDTSIHEYIESLISTISVNLAYKIEDYKYQSILSRIKHILIELVSNVYEHAYDDDLKLVGVFIRFRFGGENTQGQLEELNKVAKNEQNDQVQLDSFFYYGVPNFIEVFVVDNGKGLIKNYFSTEELKSMSLPFLRSWEKAFINGERGLNSDGKLTNTGGLHLVNTNGADYFCSRDGAEWIGVPFPYLYPSTNQRDIKKEIEEGYCVKGFSTITRLSWQEKNDILWDGINDKVFLDQYKSLDSFYSKKFNGSLKELLLKNIGNLVFIEDDRFSFCKSREPLFFHDNYYTTGTSVYFCLYLPSADISKNDIIKNVVNKFDTKYCDLRTLIIGDIKPEDCQRYLLSLEKAIYSDKFVQHFKKIILISNRLRVKVLVSDGTTFKVSSQESTAFANENIINESDIQVTISDYLSLLRTHDSLVFWQNIKRLNDLEGEELFVNSDIEWFAKDSDGTLKGFLHLQRVLNNIDLYEIIENSLSRLYGFSLDVEFESTDPIVSQLVENLNN